MAKNVACECRDTFRWISALKIDEATIKALCFKESLAFCSKNNRTFKAGKHIGDRCISVETCGPQARQFLILVRTSLKVGDYYRGSRVISVVTRGFRCLEESNTEYHYDEDGLHKKTLFVGIENDSYRLRVTFTSPQGTLLTEDNVVSPCCGERLMTEGTNVLFMRHLAILNRQGRFTFKSITIEGEIATREYKCKAVEGKEANDGFIRIHTMERKLRKDESLVQSLETYFTPRGRILRHEWLRTSFPLVTDPSFRYASIAKIKRDLSVTLAPLDDEQSDNIRVLSKYLDRTDYERSRHVTYVDSHQELKHLLADYMLDLLAAKPVDALDFSIQYLKTIPRHPRAVVSA